MSKKYRVKNSDWYRYDYLYSYYRLKEGDIVTKIEGSVEDDLYELPKHLHGKGHKGDLYDKHLNLQEHNYVYIAKTRLEEIKEKEMKEPQNVNDYIKEHGLKPGELEIALGHEYDEENDVTWLYVYKGNENENLYLTQKFRPQESYELIKLQGKIED